MRCKSMIFYKVENPGIDPGTSRMLSEHSTIWANPPWLYLFVGQTFSPDWLIRIKDMPIVLLQSQPVKKKISRANQSILLLLTYNTIYGNDFVFKIAYGISDTFRASSNTQRSKHLQTVRCYTYCCKEKNVCGLFLDKKYWEIYHEKQSGAVEACWAHNPEVQGSKPCSAILILL